MRQVYAHDAVLILPAAANPGLDLNPPVAHHIGVTRDGDRLTLRILFAAAPDRVDEVRDRIDAALAAGDGELISSGCARIGVTDRDQARRLLRAG